MPISKKKWFCEKMSLGKRAGKIKHCFFIDKLVFKGNTNFQEVLIFDNSVYDRILCLDNIVQFSKSDEFIYHETMVHPVLFSHPKPENILIIGGGDGGVLREVLKHQVKKVDLVEIDKEIIKLSKKYLKSVCQDSFSDKRVNLYNLPGESFVKNYKNFYDVIIIDPNNPEPESFSPPLFSIKFYRGAFSALKKDGIIITLGASFLDFKNFIKTDFKRLKKVFSFVSIYRFTMPSYHCGEYSFIAGSKDMDLNKVDFKKIEERFKKVSKRHKFKYYSPQIHESSMILPKNWQL